MSINSQRSKDAEAFDAFRRQLIRTKSPVQGEIRQLWLERLVEMADQLFPDMERQVRKPGLATRMFSIEIAFPWREQNDLLILASRIEEEWPKGILPGAESHTHIFPDRRDLYWEFAVAIDDWYLTGAIKLRSAPFTMPKGGEGAGERPFDRKATEEEGQERPNRDRGDRKPWERRDRPQGDRYRDDRPYSRDRNRDDRPYNRDRENKPWERRDDRPRPFNRDRGGEGQGGDRPPFNRDRQDKPWERRDDRPRPFNRDRNEGGERKPWENRGDRPFNRDRQDKPWERRDDRPRPFNRDRNEGGERKPWENRGDRPFNRDRNDRERPPFNRDRENKPWERRDDRPRPFNRDRGGEGQGGDRLPFNRDRGAGGDRKPWENRESRPPFNRDRQEGGDRPFERKPRPPYNQNRESKPWQKNEDSRDRKPGGYPKRSYRKRDEE